MRRKPSRGGKSGASAKIATAVAAAEVLRERPKRSKARPPARLRAAAARELRDTAPDGADWVHEVKFDGYRLQARIDHGEVRLLTRKALDWTDKFRPVADALAKLPSTPR